MVPAKEIVAKYTVHDIKLVTGRFHVYKIAIEASKIFVLDIFWRQ